MSQSPAPFGDPAIEPLPTQMSQEPFTPEYLDRGFAEYEFDPTSSSANSEVLHELDFHPGDALIPTTDSSNSTTVYSTPDYSGYTYDQGSPSTCSTPGQNTPHTYTQLQESYDPHPQYQPQHYAQRLFPTHSQTTTPFLRSQKTSLHRSLSQGDADAIAAAAQGDANPRFMRLKPAPNNDGRKSKKRKRLHNEEHTEGNASQGRRHIYAHSKGSVVMPTSAPMYDPTTQQIMLRTEIGTPIVEDVSVADTRGLSVQSTSTSDSHMSHQDQADRNRIAALLNRPNVNPTLLQSVQQVLRDKGGVEGSIREALKSLDDVEEGFRQGLKECEVARKALTNMFGALNYGAEV